MLLAKETKYFCIIILNSIWRHLARKLPNFSIHRTENSQDLLKHFYYRENNQHIELIFMTESQSERSASWRYSEIKKKYIANSLILGLNSRAVSKNNGDGL